MTPDFEEKVTQMSLDAKRYRKLRMCHWSDGPIAVVHDPKQNLKLGSLCLSEKLLDAYLDTLPDTLTDLKGKK